MLEQWIPIMVALIAGLSAIIAYFFNAKVNRREALLIKRREVFSNYVRNVQINLVGQKDNIGYQTALAEIFIYGTDKVVRSVNEFHEEVADKGGQVDGKRAAQAYAKMIREMREDCFSKTALEITDLMQCLPFKY